MSRVSEQQQKMGTHDHLINHLKVGELRNRSQILIVASAGELELLSLSSSRDLLPGLALAAHGSDEEIPEAMFADVSLAIVEVDPYNHASTDRIARVRQRHPSLPLIAAINGTNVSLVRTLVRQGISDVVSLPFDLTELLQVTLDVVAKGTAPPTQGPVLAPLIAFARSIGGCGATSLATHLAADLVANDTNRRGTIVVDLDLQFGSVADYLGVRPRGSISDLLGVHDRLDEELLRSVVAESSSGVSVISAPETIMPLESVETDDLLRLVRLLRQQYGYVILDLPANWTNWTLSAALAADAVVLVVEQTIASLRQAKRRLELFRSVGIDDSVIQIVVNRVEKRLFKTIDLADVANALGHSILGSVTLDAPVVSSAQNQGMLVSEVQRKSKFVADVAQIGTLLRQSRLVRSG